MKKHNKVQPLSTKRKAEKRRKKLKSRPPVATVYMGPQPQNTWFANRIGK